MYDNAIKKNDIGSMYIITLELNCFFLYIFIRIFGRHRVHKIRELVIYQSEIN